MAVQGTLAASASCHQSAILFLPHLSQLCPREKGVSGSLWEPCGSSPPRGT